MYWKELFCFPGEDAERQKQRPTRVRGSRVAY